jgi:hypothetical protein
MQSTLLLAFTFSAALFCSGAVLAASEQTTTESPSGATAPGGTPSPGKKINPPVQPRASITLDCGGGKKFKISTGTNTGSCSQNSAGAHCSIGGNTVAMATCPDGCQITSGTGSCNVAQ